uniref:Perforin 1.9 n=1 Tax=Sinocyclocheilus anshuiensis TaxID=1608454 RepID=A0A671RFL4_9TELE
MIPVILWSGLLLYLPPPTSPACFLGKEAECQDANFVPGSDLAGEDFDITKIQRLGTFVIDMCKWQLKNNTCNLCKNPFMQDKKQKLPVSVIYWRATQNCRRSLYSSVYESSESLVSSSTSSVENNWKAGLGIGNVASKMSLMLAGTNSKLAEYSMTKTKKAKFSFIKQSTSCGYYSYSIRSHSSLHRELSYFGTHYIVQVIQNISISMCTISLSLSTSDEVKTCLDVEASASVMGRISIDTAYRHCKQNKDKKLNTHSFANRFVTGITGGHAQDTALLFSSSNDPGAYNQWLSSVPEKPDVISFSLKPLHMLLPASGLWGDYFSQTDMYVKVLRNHKDFLGETSVIWNQNSPTWNWKFELGSFVLSQFGGLRLEVWDRDNNDFCRLNHGLLYYKTAVTCGPSLAGSSCTEYVGSPMSSHLEKIYVSRHVRPVPKDVLVKMGVL